MSAQSMFQLQLPRVLAASALLAALLLGWDAAGGKEVELKEVPAKAKKAVKALFKEVTWTEAEVSKHEGKEHFELFGTDGKGRKVSAEVTADGMITSAEIEIDPKSVPKAVKEALAKRIPKFEPTIAHKIYEGDDIRDLKTSEYNYQLHGTAAKGKDTTVEISREGKILEVKREIDLKEVPKLVTDALEKRMPEFRPDMVHRITEEDVVSGYSFTGHRAKGKRKIAMFVSADGKKVHVDRDH